MSSNEYLTDAASRHAVFIQRYSKSVERTAGVRLDEILSEVVKLIADGNVGDVRLTVTRMFGDLEQDLLDGILEFAKQESGFTIEMLEKATDGATFTAVESEQIDRFVAHSPMDVSPGRQLSIRQALSGFSNTQVQKIEQTLADARTDGLTQMQAVTKLRQLTQLQKTQAGAMVRTANNAASTIAAFRTFQKNPDIFEGYKWVATLDLSTTMICASRDGQTYPFTLNSPIPPAHWGCRSVIIPKVKKQYDLFADLDGGRPSETGEVSANTSYGGWLRKQPKTFVDEALGPNRSKLFRSGKLKITDFVDETGREYTLEELRVTHNVTL